ncbi:MAG: DNA topoisomerase VI subunit B [Candidatus Aenigmarchaeota archaeon]|nr:DNA topoisomerase VI subunit B [Candidatus Aenigmarchaeota archaeon]
MTQAREISVSEFFEKNRHLLGYDNKIKALLIIVKEGVDNSLDATEEARILPEIYLKVEELEKEKYKIVIRDNGPGIIKAQIPKIFGTLLYGSKFHRLKQGRGQQGLGISCAVMYSQLTTGEPTEIISSTGDGRTHRYKLKIDVKKNEPIIIEESEEPSKKPWHGVQITFIVEGIYREHKQSVLEYVKQTAVANPFADLIFDSPTGRLSFKRGIEQLPKEPQEIQPHLEGVEVGVLSRMLHETAARSVSSFLSTEFTRIGKTTALEICEKAGIDPKISPRRATDEDVIKVVKAVKEVKLTKPPTDVLSPLGEELIEKGLKKELNPEFLAVISRPPAVYRGFPFQLEVGIAWGGSIAEPNFMRFANRVPLLYQQGDCAITKSIMGVDWKRYGIEVDKLPLGPVAIMVHICSVWVPFTSESKEAVASYPVIIKETKLALQEAARKLSLYLAGKRRAEYQAERMKIFERYAEETARALEELTGEKAEKIRAQIRKIVAQAKPEDIEGEADDAGGASEGGGGEE